MGMLFYCTSDLTKKRRATEQIVVLIVLVLEPKTVWGCSE